MIIGLIIGITIGVVLHMATLSSYKRVLVMKAEDETPEHINGKFYYIVEENDFLRKGGE